jgi:LmbE family N-acetylglucosaminyl deacetylase
LTLEEDHLVSVRKEGAARAAKIVGIQELLFLDCPDSSLQSSPTAVDRLRKILEERRPSIIYLPSPLDLHADHWATNCIFHDASKNLVFSGDWRLVYRAYEV